MARILENDFGKRNILLSTEDIICIVQEYQEKIKGSKKNQQIRKKLNNIKFYIPEELI